MRRAAFGAAIAALVWLGVVVFLASKGRDALDARRRTCRACAMAQRGTVDVVTLLR